MLGLACSLLAAEFLRCQILQSVAPTTLAVNIDQIGQMLLPSSVVVVLKAVDLGPLTRWPDASVRPAHRSEDA